MPLQSVAADAKLVPFYAVWIRHNGRVVDCYHTKAANSKDAYHRTRTALNAHPLTFPDLPAGVVRNLEAVLLCWVPEFDTFGNSNLSAIRLNGPVTYDFAG